MANSFVNIDRDTPLLLPPDLRDWVPADHLAHFVLLYLKMMFSCVHLRPVILETANCR